MRFTRHARNRLRWLGRRHGITEQQVEETLLTPDAATASIAGRINAWKQIPVGWLRVTHVREQRGIVIITVTVTDRGPTGG